MMVLRIDDVDDDSETILARECELKSVGHNDIDVCPWCGAQMASQRSGTYKVGGMSYMKMSERRFSCSTVILRGKSLADYAYILYARSDECRFACEHLTDKTDSI